MSSNISNAVPWIICGILLVVSGILIFKIIDQSVTNDHQAQHASFIQEQRDIVLEVVGKMTMGASEEEIRDTLKTLAAESYLEVDKNQIVAAHVTFRFRDGKLASVSVK